MSEVPLWRALGAEVVGTFALVFAGCGAIMVDATRGGLGHVGVALAFGLVIMVMIYAVGHISGAHFNPAVTVALAVARHVPWRIVPSYVVAQLVGALGAALLLRLSLGDVASVGATTPSGGAGESFLWEVVLTFFLVFVIMAVATDPRAAPGLAGLAVGGTVGLDALVGGPISGASMNPARSLGPAIVAAEGQAQWVYVLAPLLGALLAVAAYRVVGGQREAEQNSLRAHR